MANRGDWTIQVLRADDGLLTEGETYPVDANPSDVAIAGVNGRDVLTVSPVANTLTVLLNDGAGKLVAQTPIPVVAGATTLATGQLGGLPGVDVAVAGTSGALQVLVNNGAGVLTTKAPIALGGTPVDISVSEMDGINGRDVVVRLDGGIQMFLNDGAGNLITLPPVAAAGRSSMTVAQLDEKPGPDALVAAPDISLLQILSNDGGGNLSDDRTRKVNGGPTYVGVGNFDGG